LENARRFPQGPPALDTGSFHISRVQAPSNKGSADWDEVFNDQVLATEVLDRLLHHATTVNIMGESYRLREKQKTGLLGRRSPQTPREDEAGDAA